MRRGFHCATSSYSSFNFLRAACGVLTMNTSAHLANRSRTCCALAAFRLRATPRLFRLANSKGYGSSECGCGGILCPYLHGSPSGGSTLITSAPKSDRIVAAAGPAMKFARSTTLSPEKIWPALIRSLILHLFVCLCSEARHNVLDLLRSRIVLRTQRFTHAWIARPSTSPVKLVSES